VPEREGRLLGHHAIAQGLQLVIAADADGGVCDVPVWQAHHPFHEAWV